MQYGKQTAHCFSLKGLLLQLLQATSYFQIGEHNYFQHKMLSSTKHILSHFRGCILATLRVEHVYRQVGEQSLCGWNGGGKATTKLTQRCARGQRKMASKASRRHEAITKGLVREE